MSEAAPVSGLADAAACRADHHDLCTADWCTCPCHTNTKGKNK